MAKTINFGSDEVIFGLTGQACVEISRLVNDLLGQAREYEFARLKGHLEPYPVEDWPRVLSKGLFEVEDSEKSYLFGKVVRGEHFLPTTNKKAVLANIERVLARAFGDHDRFPSYTYDISSGHLVLRFDKR